MLLLIKLNWTNNHMDIVSYLLKMIKINYQWMAAAIIHSFIHLDLFRLTKWKKTLFNSQTHTRNCRIRRKNKTQTKQQIINSNKRTKLKKIENMDTIHLFVCLFGYIIILFFWVLLAFDNWFFIFIYLLYHSFWFGCLGYIIHPMKSIIQILFCVRVCVDKLLLFKKRT